MFSQYHDSVQWLAQQLSESLVDVLEDGLVGVYHRWLRVLVYAILLTMDRLSPSMVA